MTENMKGGFANYKMVNGAFNIIIIGSKLKWLTIHYKVYFHYQESQTCKKFGKKY